MMAYKSIVLIEPYGSIQGLNNGLAYLSAVLVNAGLRVRVLDFNSNSANIDKRLLEVKGFDAIGISVKSANIKSSIDIAAKARRLNKDALIVAGGTHITLDGVNFMQENPDFDVGVVGEGEYIFLDLLQGKKLSGIEGLIYRKDGKTESTKRGDWIRNLDDMPFPNYDHFDSFDGTIKVYPLLTSRGCPFNCIYCAAPLVLGAWRSRSPENVIDELIHAKKKYNIREFNIYDDNFTVDVKRAIRFCELLIERNINLPWFCPNGIKVTSLNDKLADLMKKSGCYLTNVGIESGVERIYNGINKGGSLEVVVRGIKILQKHGIKVYGFFIVGLPGSTFELDMQSLRFAQNLKLASASWDIAMPYPNTMLTHIIKTDKQYRILRDWKEVSLGGRQTKTVFDTAEYPERKRLDMYYIGNLQSRFYGAFIDNDLSFFSKISTLLTIILKYDPKHLFRHLFFITKLFIRQKILK
jgi:anaerobic magnesium-protoporphyrin IX monomethyl ester cyclase